MALSPSDPWRYFGASAAAARDALRERMGASYTSVDDDDVDAALRGAVAYLERGTGRFFTIRSGTLTVDGHGTDTLVVTHPIVSVEQGGTSITSITIEDDTDAVDATSYQVHDGAEVGPDDPRDLPRVVFRPPGTGAPLAGGVWPAGRRNVHLVGTFGYVEDDGSVPELVLDCLARLAIRQLVPLDDEEGQQSRLAGYMLSDSVQGRTWTLDRRAVGTGLTGDRAIDGVINSYRRPPRVKVANGARRARNRGTTWWR